MTPTPEPDFDVLKKAIESKGDNFPAGWWLEMDDVKEALQSSYRLGQEAGLRQARDAYRKLMAFYKTGTLPTERDLQRVDAIESRLNQLKEGKNG